MTPDPIAAIVVHHQSYDSVAIAVTAAVSQGISGNRVVVVDNSGEPERRSELVGSLPHGVHVVYVENSGYGAAVNHGIDWIRVNLEALPQFVLVMSHEALAAKGAIDHLRTALINDPRAAVAGPTLVTGSEQQPRVWSQGGYLSRISHRPMHHGHMQRQGGATSLQPVRRSWLDGAFLLYRFSDLAEFRFDEDYFLYMEETDLHLRLGRAGKKILWVPEAVAWQSSNGVPPYWFARNIRLLYARNDASWRRRYMARVLTARRAIALLKRGELAAALPALWRGTVTPLPSREPTTASATIIVNPLGAALRHYQSELADLLGLEGTAPRVLTVTEPSVSGEGRATWLAKYLMLLIQAGARVRTRRSGKAIVVWPALGYWDLPLVRLLVGRRSALVVHDPVPLTRAVGYGRTARRLGSFFGRGVQVVVHSDAARRALDPGISADSVVLLPHPMLRVTASPESECSTASPVIRVLGQFKPDRDVDALKVLGGTLGTTATLEIHGRGWPDIDGWKVDSTFVSEAELTSLVASSSAVLIPYHRFYQSGIAIRCLEQATPVVGPAESSLADVLGHDSRLLVGNADDWARAVQHATRTGAVEILQAARAWRVACERSWTAWKDLR